MFADLREGSVTLEDTTVDYAVFGKGQTPLVILPGLSFRDVKGAGAGLALMYRIFWRDFRVYVLDKKAEIPENCTVKALSEDTAQTMAALGIANAYVFGVSLGGMIAQRLAIDHPQLVRGLVLGVTASRTNETLAHTVGRWIASVRRDAFGEIVSDMLEVMYSASYGKRYGWLFPILARFCMPKNKTRFLRLAKACLTCDTYEELHRIACPTLVLGGREDRIVTGEASAEIAERLVCEKALRLWEGLGHAAYEEAKDFNAEILSFLKQRIT